MPFPLRIPGEPTRLCSLTAAASTARGAPHSGGRALAQLHTGPEKALVLSGPEKGGLTPSPTVTCDLGPVTWPLRASVYLSVSWDPPASGAVLCLGLSAIWSHNNSINGFGLHFPSCGILAQVHSHL